MLPPGSQGRSGDEAEASDSSGSVVKITSSATRRINGSKPQTTGTHPTVQVAPARRLTEDVDDGSDDEGPDVEEASDARAREEQRVAADVALQAERKQARRALSKAREATAKARKDKKAKRMLLQKQRAETAASDVLPQDVLERAANAAEHQERTLTEAAQKQSMSSQAGVLRVVQKERFVDGLEVVDSSLAAQQRAISRKPRQSKKAETPAARALNFMQKSLYGFEHHRISAVRAAAKRKGSHTKSGKSSKHGESSRLLNHGAGKRRKFP